MERITQAQQAQIKKMSTGRLRLRLLSAGYEEEVLEGMERTALVEAYAQLVAEGAVRPELAVTYDPAVERDRLAFEQRKWEAEQQRLAAEREDRLRKEDAERVERHRKEETEKERWEAEMEERRRRDDLKERELLLMAQKNDEERERRDSAAMKGKLFGDAMRSAAIHMGPDALDAVPFFKNVEQLFTVYEVPTALQAILVRPFLNDRAKIFMAKLDPIISGNYQHLRDAILKEFKLSPNVYLNKFNTMQKDRDETYNMFASRLQGLLQFYLDSRNVSTFTRLFELLICDRIKTTLTEACLRHVLSVESATEGGWLNLRQLTDTIDRYVAAHPVSDEPQAFAIGQTTKDETDQGYGNRSTTEVKNTPVALARTNPSRFGSGPVRNQENRNEIRRCFNCLSPGHLRINCPLLKREQAGVRRVAVENTSCVTANYGRQYSPNPGMINDGVSGQYDDSTGRPITRRISELGESDVTIDRGESGSYTQQQQAAIANHSELSADFVSQIEATERNPTGDVMNEVGVSFMSSAPVATAAVNHVPIQHFTTDCDSIGVDNVSCVNAELPPLKYIDVQICGDNSDVIKVTSGLIDSGSEITCIRADLVSELSPVVKGKVMLKPFCGSPIAADLICLQLRVCTDGTSAMSSKFVHVWCASVPELNDSLILTADTVQRLVNSCHDICELSDDVVMPLTKVSRVVTHSVAKKRSRSVDDDTNDTLLQTNSAVSDNTDTSL